MYHYIGTIVFLISCASLSYAELNWKDYVGALCQDSNAKYGKCQNTCEDTGYDGANLIDARNNHSADDADAIACPDPLTCCIASSEAPNEVGTEDGRQGLPKHNVKLGSDEGQKPCGWRRGPEGTDGLAARGEIPWTAAVVLLQGVENGVKNAAEAKPSIAFLGNGAIIHSKVVLTTSHSLRNSTTIALFVVVGDYDSSDQTENKLVLPVDEVVKHPDFNISTGGHDYALLFLPNPVNLPHVAPVCLPRPNQAVPAGTSCFFTGWGRDCKGEVYQHVLTKTEVPIVGRSRCQSLLRRTPFGSDYTLLPSFVCAGGERKDICKGAGGSPLVCPIEDQQDRYMLTGLVVFAATDGTDGTPTMFANVAYARDWIDKIMTERGLELAYEDY